MDGRDELIGLGGMFEGVQPRPNTADRIENLRLDPEGFWQTMPGTIAITSLALSSGPIQSLCWFNPRPGQRWLVLERGIDNETSRIEYLDFRTQGTTLIATRRRVPAADRGTLFVAHERWLYMFNAQDAPIRWNGEWTAPVGYVGKPGAPHVAGPNEGFDHYDRAAGTYPSSFRSRKQRGVGPYPGSTAQDWRYAYALTVVNEVGQESPLSPVVYASGTNTAVDAGGKKFVRIHIGRQPDHIRAVRLYRSANLEGASGSTDPSIEPVLFFLDEFMFAGEIDLLDHAQDSELGLPFNHDQTGPVPLGARAAAFWQGSLWLGGAASDPTRLYYSSALFPEQFPAINFVPVGSSRTGAIVALWPSPRGLVVFKEGGVYLIVGDHSTEFRCLTISDTIGCAAPRAIENVRGIGLMFLATSGPHVLKGTESQDGAASVSPVPGIRRTWRRYAGHRLAQAVSVYDDEFQEVWFQVPVGGDRNPKLGIVFHASLEQWSLRTDWTISSFARQFGKTWIGSWDENRTPGVHLLTESSTTVLAESGVPTPDDSTGFYRFDEVAVDKQLVHHVEAWVLAFGQEVIQVDTRADFMASRDQTETGKQQLLNARDRDQWGFVPWDSGVWYDWDPTRLQIATRFAFGATVRVKLTSARMRLYAVNLRCATTPVDPKPERRP